ncbi:phosphodiesterase [Ilumatobacter sp.]|uniref:phosphodiesterase n=1 Tax=Ilumatobacter sp. TaxID=1967498 RepID=UPI003B515678
MLDRDAPVTLIAQLSDLHVVTSDTDAELHVDNVARVRAVVSSVVREDAPVDAVVITGDLVNDEHPREYEVLAELLAPIDAPVLVVPGNHDSRDLVREAFPTLAWVDADHASWVAEVAGVRVVGLDSTRPGHPGAELDDERARWLETVLAVGFDGPTVIAMHHPPFATGIGWMDDSGFVGRELFVEVLATSSVDRILCGHVHRPISSSVAGVVAQVGLSPVQHVALDLRPGAPVSLVRDPVGYQVLRFATGERGGEIVVHTRYVDTVERPFRPRWADSVAPPS